MRKSLWAGTALVLIVAVFPINAAEPAEDRVKASLAKYLLAWNEPDEAKRRELLTGHWTTSGTYTDPSGHAEGLEGLVAHIGEFKSNPQFKGFSIVRTSGIDIHHQSLRFNWEMRTPNGKILTAGIDYGEFDDEGRITKIVGFFGPFPKMED
ncbi:MAG: hypothetical protein COA73_15825 [Candidatus Hydrogenedentota bacterium]|nr:MAG: hypothetical protein COA73_15825 [Candidatus Hydrogenedentota bacterium]